MEQDDTTGHSRPCARVYFTGSSLALFGLLVVIGWISHEPRLIRVVPGFSGMPYSTAFGFVLLGLALLATGIRSRIGRVEVVPSSAYSLLNIFTAILPGLIILLGLLALAEWLTGAHLGLTPNPEAVRHWFVDANPYSGQMRPMAAIAFVALGLAMGLVSWSRGPQAAVFAHGLTLLAMFLGLVGVVGDVVGLGRIFSWYIGPVFLAGICFLAAGFALLAILRQHSIHRLSWHSEDADKIGLIAGAIIFITGMSGIIGGFAVLYPQAVGELESNLALSLKSRSDMLEAAIQQTVLDSNSFANQPLSVDAMRRLDADPKDTHPWLEIQEVAARYRAFGFSGVVFRDTSGVEIARAGSFVASPGLSVRLTTSTPSQLLWDAGYVLHAHASMTSEGIVVGTLEAERRLAVGEGLHDAIHLGNTLDFAVCAPAGRDAMNCFPFRSTGGKVLRDLPGHVDGEPIPAAHALAGQTGIIHTRDYRGTQVIAAHQPIGSLGLGAVLKIDAEELYSPIAQRLKPLLLLVLILGVAAIYLLRLQVMPLMRKLTEEINERRKAEAGLEEARAELTEITSTLGEGVYVLDEDGIVTFVNPEAERLLGWTSAELVGKNAHDTFHYRTPDGTTVPSEACPVHQTIRTGQTHRALHDWVIRKDGEFVPVSIVSSPILRGGRVKGAVASFYDITQRLTQEAALRESEERFRLISTAATDGIITMDPEGGIGYWNPAAAKIFGYSQSEAIGQQLHDLLAPSRHLEAFHRGFEQFRRSGTGPIIGRTFEITAMHRNGQEFPAELSVSALRIKDQWHALGVIRDISERKRTEEQIRHLAYYDFLTDLPNRRLFIDRLNQGLIQAQRNRRSLAVLYLDLDRFKVINDTLGHDVGDGLLVAVAGRLRDCVRSSDTVSRLGGDEFAIVLVEIAQPRDAAVVAEKVLVSLQEAVQVGDHRLKISTSIGIAIYPIDGTDNAQALIKKADIALYEAKGAGRNRYAFFTDVRAG